MTVGATGSKKDISAPKPAGVGEQKPELTFENVPGGRRAGKDGWGAEGAQDVRAVQRSSSASSVSLAETWTTWAQEKLTELTQLSSVPLFGRFINFATADDKGARVFAEISNPNFSANRAVLSRTPDGRELLQRAVHAMDDGNVPGTYSDILKGNALIVEAEVAAMSQPNKDFLAPLFEKSVSALAESQQKVLKQAWVGADDLEPGLANLVRDRLLVFAKDTTVAAAVRENATPFLLDSVGRVDVDTALVLLPQLGAQSQIDEDRSPLESEQLGKIAQWQATSPKLRADLFVLKPSEPEAFFPDATDRAMGFVAALLPEFGLNMNIFKGRSIEQQSRVIQALYTTGLARLDAGIAALKNEADPKKKELLSQLEDLSGKLTDAEGGIERRLKIEGGMKELFKRVSERPDVFWDDGTVGRVAIDGLGFAGGAAAGAGPLGAMGGFAAAEALATALNKAGVPGLVNIVKSSAGRYTLIAAEAMRLGREAK